MPLDTPIGQIVLEADGDVLIGLRLPNDSGLGRRDEEYAGLEGGRDPAGGILRRRAHRLRPAHGARRHPVPTRGLGRADAHPYGETISYGELARRVGRPKGPRAVGQANGRNPIAIIVPCHRVLASNGIGGYGGGLTCKRALLALEGVTA